jgi:hypothetical protein
MGELLVLKSLEAQQLTPGAPGAARSISFKLIILSPQCIQRLFTFDMSDAEFLNINHVGCN